MSQPRSRFSPRLAAIAVPMLLIIAACTPSATPEEYNATTRDNFMEACQDERAEPRDSVADICECSYDRITASDGIPFEDFKSLDDDLRSNIDTQLTSAVAAIVADCIRQSAS